MPGYAVFLVSLVLVAFAVWLMLSFDSFLVSLVLVAMVVLIIFAGPLVGNIGQKKRWEAMGKHKEYKDRGKRATLQQQLGGEPAFFEKVHVSKSTSYFQDCFYGIRGDTLCFGNPIDLTLTRDQITRYRVSTDFDDDISTYTVQLTTNDLQDPLRSITFLHEHEKDQFIARLQIFWKQK